MLSVKYTPTTQKALFHKDVVAHIRKWIVHIQGLADNNKKVQHVLLLCGPTGCGKTTTVDVLFKAYNITSIDAVQVRSGAKIQEITSSIAGFTDRTLSNIEKWNQKGKKDRCNIVLVDNIELCERSLNTLIETIHTQKNINVPIVLIGTSPKIKETLNGHPNLHMIEFKKPSLLELTKLIDDINREEQLQLTKENIKDVVEASEFDVRQVLHILEQWRLSTTNFLEFIETLARKHVDLDLNEKLQYLLDPNATYDIETSYLYSAAEPLTITNGIFQNYPTTLEFLQRKLPLKHTAPTVNNCNNQGAQISQVMSSVAECISSGNTFNSKIFEEQCWELYNDYAMNSCVAPSMLVKDGFQQNGDVDVKHHLQYNLVPFKDVSYNFMNSFQEVKEVCGQNAYNSHLRRDITVPFSGIYNCNIDVCFSMVSVFLNQLNTLNTYFDNNKKGKNTSKKEKLDICNSIQDGPEKIALDNIVGKMYYYGLFEVDVDDLILNRKLYLTNEAQQKYFTKVDIRMFKRFMNIFCISESASKVLKPHVEASLRYKLFQKIVEGMPNCDITITCDKNVDDMVGDLGTIWNLSIN